MHSYDEPVYLISVVATMLDIHPQTLRQYEREGLVEPSRTQGRMRLYSQRDIERMKLILRLTRQMGVNLAGVDLVLQLKEQIDEMQKEMEKLILRLTRQMGVNLAGVDLVLQLKEQIDEMQEEMDLLRDELRKSNRNGSVHSSKALVAKSTYDIIIFED